MLAGPVSFEFACNLDVCFDREPNQTKSGHRYWVLA